MHLIETKNLVYEYPGSVSAISGLNFIAPRNSRIAVIGSNGAGKSTLFRHFNGILKPSSGTVFVRGEPISKDNLREVRKFVGVVFQNADDQIFAPTVREDVGFGPTNLGLPPEMVEHRVNEALHMLRITDLADRVPHHLSGGEKKRVAIAGVIAMEPQVLVLDEPTAGLDPQGVEDLIAFINTLSKKYGMTIISATHDLSLLPLIADYVYVMNKGAFVTQGSVMEIFDQQDLLRSVRLEVPVIPRLFYSLKKEGYAIPMALTYDEAYTALTSAVHKVE